MEKREVMFCYHCGNKTSMDLAVEHLHRMSDTIKIGPDDYYPVTFDDNYCIFICPVCYNSTIKKVHSNSEDYDYDGSPLVTEEILYPKVELSMDYLPQGIQKSYEAALKVKHIDNAISALSLRRTLEMVCKDKGVTKGNLYTKLKKLSELGILPAILDEMANVLKDVGNAAAHADDIEFSDIMVESLLEFTETILEYIYKLPVKLKRVQSQWLAETTSEEVVTEK
ncbi:DUF4145 domain-containing protein [Psychrobacillus glaciei]|uniref:DUF4145 domain-containing protein n=1 Tax=Psychrobacillus glaciei TaxID=2283160 RepID=A0A5J6SN07_9BACI|nr:DUF4145 domain-containing protein [Psychrobacillus glaciei]QFF98823.1 DUF4145 domain-containing protein [Psychrobacillus glaciei]